MRKGEAKLRNNSKIHSKKIIEAQLRGDTSLNHITENRHKRKKK